MSERVVRLLRPLPPLTIEQAVDGVWRALAMLEAVPGAEAHQSIRYVIKECTYALLQFDADKVTK